MALQGEEQTIRVVLVDDHAVVREGTQLILDAAPGIKVVAGASSGAEALRMVERHQPDVLLLDLQLPDMSGVDVARAMRRSSPQVAILVLTGNEAAGVGGLLELGVRGFLHKTASGAEIVAAVRAVATGRMMIVGAPSGVATTSLASLLTARELEILRLMAAGLRNADIARQLTVSVKTVEHHVTNILMKLHVQSRTQAAMKAQQHFGLAVGA